MHEFNLGDIPTEGLYHLQERIEAELQARREAERDKIYGQIEEVATRYQVDVAYFLEGFPAKKRGRPKKAKSQNNGTAQPASSNPPVEPTRSGIDDNA